MGCPTFFTALLHLFRNLCFKGKMCQMVWVSTGVATEMPVFPVVNNEKISAALLDKLLIRYGSRESKEAADALGKREKLICR